MLSIDEARVLSLSHHQVRGGLTFREGHYICEAIADTGLLAALDLMVSSRLPLNNSGVTHKPRRK
jgi:hypothetical protein